MEEKQGCEFCRGEYESEIGDCNLTIEYVPVLSNGLMIDCGAEPEYVWKEFIRINDDTM